MGIEVSVAEGVRLLVLKGVALRWGRAIAREHRTGGKRAGHPKVARRKEKHTTAVSRRLLVIDDYR